MTAKNRATIELHFSDGTTITAWKRFSWRDSFTDPLGSLELVAHPPIDKRSDYRTRLAKGNLISLRLNNNPQATMLITTYSETISGSGVEMKASCKSVLATAYEGSVDPNVAQTFTADTAVSDAVLSALSLYGFDTLNTDAANMISAMTGKALSGQATDVIATDLKHKDVQASPGEKAYPFAARIFGRLGVVLRTRNDGTLLLQKPDYEQAAAYTLLEGPKINRTGDRMLADPGITITDTNDGQYSEVVVVGKEADKRGQKSASAPANGVQIEGGERPDGVPFEDVALEQLPAGRHNYSSPSGASYKPLIHYDKKARDKVRALNSAKLIMSARASRAYQVRCAVDGFVSQTGRVWTVGTVARVVSDSAEIDENMWILETMQRADANGGQRTELTLIPLHALTLGEP